MRWNIDLSAITPGPGGTVMLGEGGIDAAARRYRERIRKQQEEADALAKLKDGEVKKGDDAASEVTLTQEGDADGDGDAKRDDRGGVGTDGSLTLTVLVMTANRRSPSQSPWLKEVLPQLKGPSPYQMHSRSRQTEPS
ncbi:uncharacterized protein BDW47DRAFT_124957 [Aspergillus candidus]|uniref:Uncharacterized protein n=1 Tax=Aspergillus candidus TaxID=41067 RepID=A0A2I2FEI5_ASPCN|nr:hypothetical protein BDW47DRAFT_124957 [Aspergillus candidus]PLB39036.1 hypothetical protein BDW47DRAFT_124957 [Aspergillus candidus]